MDNKKKLDGFVLFLLDMDNVQAERNELKLLVDPRYWRWSNRKLLRKIRKVGNVILKKGLQEKPQEPMTVAPAAPSQESEMETAIGLPSETTDEETPPAG
ncbi:hypothetical protein FACS1894211_16700 [Clostridia bacterium]|nr:hypothetical protein FACS1894211_16700 [Clostridia bacterium]